MMNVKEGQNNVRDIVKKPKNKITNINLKSFVDEQSLYLWERLSLVVASWKKNNWWAGNDIYAALFFGLLIIIVTWPLIFHLNSMIPGVGNDRGDSFHFVWNMWWVKKNILSGQDLFWTDYIYYPGGVSLIYHTLTIGQALLSLVFMMFLPLLVVFNGCYLLFMFLAAFGTYILVKNLWKSERAAFLSGVIFGFSPYVMAHSLGHFNLTAIWPLPWIALLSLRIRKKRKWSEVFGLSLLMVFLFLNDFHYFLFSSLLFGLIIGYDLFTKRFSIKNISVIVKTILVGLLVFVLVFPMLFKSIEAAKIYIPGALLSEVSYWSADLVAFVTPSFLHSLWGSVGQQTIEKYQMGGVESVVYIGWTVIGLIVLSIIFKSTNKNEKINKRLWWLVLLFFFVMSLGPLLKIMGKTSFAVSDISYSVALPYIWLYELPMMSIARVPARFFAVVSLALAVISAYGYMRLENLILSKVNFFKKIMVRAIFGTVLLMLGLEYISVPMRLQDMSIPSVYNSIKEDNDDFVIMELPLWWTSGHRSEGNVITKLQYYQTFHEKKILNGSVSRVPDALFDYYLKYPGIKYLIDIENNLADFEDMSRDLVRSKWKNELKVKYIVLHKKYFEWSEYYKVREYIENVLGVEKWYEDESEIVYLMND